MVPAGAAGQRIDAHIAAQLPELSRSRVAQLMESGNVRLNGAVPRKSERVAEGDVIELEVPPLQPSVIEPEAIPLEIVYEDRDLLVVNKPAGLVVHPAPGHRSGTLVNALLHHVEDLSGIGGVKRPGIVHRLDKDTSGLMIVAKHDRAHRRLSGALKRRDINRVYLAACWGHLQEDRQTVDAPLARSRSDRKKIAVAESGRRAVTHFTRVERWVAADLLEARLETGRTHQIRVHLAHLGHPVVGDEVYGGGGARGISGTGRGWARELEARVPRQFLHAARLAFDHPRTGERIDLEARLPPDLAGAAEWARSPSTR
ncbi:MAG: RluA family pseudouridine synthase [Gemmatimonadetes bacterium]|nr:RluA family pseudouridine synthase [Gemmatimonadota bacterium]